MSFRFRLWRCALMFDFTEEEQARYSRHLLLQDVGAEGQYKIRSGKVLVIGAGGLGSPVAMYLAAAGVGTIGIVDGDVVDLSNLQRQIVHTTHDLGRAKVESAAETMRAINPNVKVTPINDFLRADNIRELIRDYDFMIDCTDSFPMKFLINDACVMEGKAFSHGGLLGYEGQTFTHLPGTACYRCMFKEPPPAETVPLSSQNGVLGAIAGMLGTIQAAEALKYLTGVGELLTDSLLTFDARTMDFRKLKAKRVPCCGVCGETPTGETPTITKQTCND